MGHVGFIQDMQVLSGYGGLIQDMWIFIQDMEVLFRILRFYSGHWDFDSGRGGFIQDVEVLFRTCRFLFRTLRFYSGHCH